MGVFYCHAHLDLLQGVCLQHKHIQAQTDRAVTKCVKRVDSEHAVLNAIRLLLILYDDRLPFVHL